MKKIPIKNQLDNLADALIDNVINTSDDDILKEVEEDYGDKNYLANKVRKILAKIKSDNSTNGEGK